MKAFNLVGIDGNAFSIMGYVLNAMKVAYRSTNEGKEQFGADAQTAYQKRAMSGDYSNLLCVSQEMVEKVNEFMKLEPAYEDDDDFYDDDEDYEDDYEDDYCADEYCGDDYSEGL